MARSDVHRCGLAAAGEIDRGHASGAALRRQGAVRTLAPVAVQKGPSMTRTRIDPQQSVSIRPPSERQTPLPASRRFREALDEGAQRIVANAASLTGVSPLSQSTTASRVRTTRGSDSRAGRAGRTRCAASLRGRRA